MIIKRKKILSQIDEWYSSTKNKGLLILGMPYIGKTFLVNSWAKEKGIRFTYISPQLYNEIKSVFDDPTNNSISLSIAILNSLFNKPSLGEVVIFDGIKPKDQIFNKIKQLCNENKHKYIFISDYGEYVLDEASFIPVGYLDVIKVNPLSFKEFCELSVAKNIIDSTLITICDKRDLSLQFAKIFEKKYEEYLRFGGFPLVVSELMSKGEYSARQSLSNISSEIKRFVRDLNFKTAGKIFENYDTERSQSYGRFVFSNISPYDNYARNKTALNVLSSLGIISVIDFRGEQLSFDYCDIYLDDVGLENTFKNIKRNHIVESAVFNSFINKRRVFREVIDRNTVIDFYHDIPIPEIIEIKSKITFGLETAASKISSFNPNNSVTRKNYILIDRGLSQIIETDKVQIMPVWAYLLSK